MLRYIFILILSVYLFGCGEAAQTSQPSSKTPADNSVGMVVYKDAQCGCCGLWVEHMEQSGFEMSVQNTTDLNAVKQQFGISPSYQSCHTLVDNSSGYIFEGHIPAFVVEKFLKEKPEGAIGLSVPGMPMGSPGMEMGDRYDAYEVMQLNRDGSVIVYERISGEQSRAMHRQSQAKQGVAL